MNFAFSRLIAALLCATFVCLSSIAPAFAADATSAIAGLVVEQRSALPVSGATVTATQGGSVAGTTKTDAAGRFSLDVAPGLYTISIRATGYAGTDNADIAVASGTVSTVNASLIASSSASAATVTTIGRTSSTRNPLQSATTITNSITPENVTQTGQIRLGAQLGTLPAVNYSSSSSVGDDSSINIRGFGPTETATLLDGHPVGPLGVGGTAFNYALWPAYGFTSVDVTYGSGAQGLFGSDTIGGAVNFVTIAPTRKPTFSFQQQIGGFGLSSTAISATGTFGKLGYAIAAGVFGEYGDFSPGQIAQSARPDNVVSPSVNPNSLCDQYGNDVSQCNLALNTYAVSQNTKLTTLLGKLTYQFSPVTNFSTSFYDAVQWADSTGNGDNDYTPYSTRLNQINNKTSDCTTTSGAAGYTVYTDPIAGVTTCYTAAQYAQATFGPNGGGAGRQRSTRMEDYNFKFNTAIGNNNIAADYYYNFYQYWKDSSLAGGIDAQGNLLGTPVFANWWNTQGLLASDEIVSGRNDLSFGYTLWHQLQTGNQLTFNPGFTTNPPQYFGEWSYFLRDSYQFNNVFSVFANLWEKHSSVTNLSTFDPRITLQARPTNHDVFQLTYGRSDGAPSPTLKSTGTPVATDPGSSLTSVSCPTASGQIIPNSVTSAGNPNLLSENANDFEAGYGHRFYADSNIQVNAYVTSVKNQLFNAVESVPSYGANNIIFAPGALATYVGKFNNQCGLNLDTTSVLPYLGVSTTYNASSALARGIEISARARIVKWAYIDAKYSMESSARTGISDAILINNPQVINGSQIAGIPIHQATLSLDAAPGAWEFRLDNYYQEFNNGLSRGSYWTSNAFLNRTFNHGTTSLTVGGTNIFNSATQVYGLIGLGYAYPTNAVSGVSPRNSEQYGNNPPQLTFTFQQKI